MIHKTHTIEHKLQQHTSHTTALRAGYGTSRSPVWSEWKCYLPRTKLCFSTGVRTRMLQDCTIAKMVLGLRFTKLTLFAN